MKLLLIVSTVLVNFILLLSFCSCSSCTDERSPESYLDESLVYKIQPPSVTYSGTAVIGSGWYKHLVIHGYDCYQVENHWECTREES